MDRRHLAALVAVVALGAIAFLLLGHDGVRSDRVRSDGVEPRPTGDGDSMSSPVELADEVGSAQLRASAHGAPDAPPAHPAAPVAAPPSDVAVLRGRLVHGDGSPIVGGRVALEGRARDVRANVVDDSAAAWTDAVQESGDDGRFAFHFVPPHGFHFDLRASADGFAPVRLVRRDVEPGATIDLGDVVLHRGGRVEGRILLPDGSPAPGTWEVHADSDWRVPHLGAVAWRTSVACERDDSGEVTYAIDGVPAGYVELDLHSPDRLADDDFPHRIAVGAGETVVHDFVYGGADVTRRLRIALRSVPSAVATGPRREYFELTDANGRTVRGSEATQIGGVVQFSELDPGFVDVVVDDPRYERWVELGAEVGTLVEGEVTPSVVVTLVVTDAATGERIEDATLELRPMRSIWPSSSEPSVRTPVARAEDGAPLHRTVPDPQIFLVGASGYATSEVRFERGFPPRSRQRVEVALERAENIAGRLVRADGAPIAETLVRARVSFGALPDPGDGAAWKAYQAKVGRTKFVESTTDTSGAFQLGPLASGSYDVVAVLPKRIAPVALAVPSGTTDLELVAPVTHHVRGRVVPAFPHVERVLVALHGPDDAPEPSVLDPLLPRSEVFRVDAEGRFELERLELGARELWLSMPGARIVDQIGEFPSAHGWAGPFEVVVEAGPANEIVVDVSDRAPVEAIVTVVWRGRPQAGLQVFAIATDAPPYGDEGRAAALTDANGAARVAPIHPGTHVFEVRPVGAPIAVRASGVHAIDPTSRPELEIEATFVEGTFTYVDGEEEPLGDVVGKLRDGDRTAFANGDAQGRRKLLLPPGTYTLEDLRFRDDTAPRFADTVLEWTEDGPAEERVVLVPR